MIDTHQHLLNPKRFNYAWAKDFPALQGELGLEQYRAASVDCGIEGTVFMEVDVDEAQSGDEARHFCGLADDLASGILGVVAAGRPEQEGFEAYLVRITHPKLKGIRRVLHTQPDAVSQSSCFRENVRALAGRGLSFDLCVLERQLPLAVELADACPDVTFVLDHCGVPDIAANSPDLWKIRISELALRTNVVCKVSGICVYASESQRTVQGLFPWFAHVLKAFGWERLLWGGDWPVCTLAVPLSDWITATHDLLDLAKASPCERQAFLEDNAKRIYRL